MKKAVALLLACSLLSGCGSSGLNAGQPTVTVSGGALTGTQEDGVNRFLGIPYAAPPVNDLRWRAPQPAAAWDGTRDASKFGPDCVQNGPRGAPPDTSRPASEDCLTLNIWAPANANGELPVMVWIHGGGYMFGSGSQPNVDGTQFAKMGVVLVTLNYRLGPFGFMAHPELTAEAEYGSSGNYGILDQIAALKWVQENIAQFGGDPANVTIFGESAGAGSVNILQASPLAKGLFAKAIGESTSQFDPNAGMAGRQDLSSAEQAGVSFGKSRGANSLAEMRALPPEKILADAPFFWPFEKDNYVLPDLVWNIFAEGKQNDVPTMVGYNSDEGATLPVEFVKRDAGFEGDYDRFYGKLDDPRRQASTDGVQWQMRVWAQLQAQTGTRPAWSYYFDRAWPGRVADGAFHGAEIVYVFQNLDTEDQPWTDDDRALSRQMAQYWVNFARTGDPNGEGLPQWPRYNPTEPRLLRLAPGNGVIETPRPEVQAFLDRYNEARR
jgi:para-nitrobenzyl esterase